MPTAAHKFLEVVAEGKAALTAFEADESIIGREDVVAVLVHVESAGRHALIEKRHNGDDPAAERIFQWLVRVKARRQFIARESNLSLESMIGHAQIVLRDM